MLQNSIGRRGAASLGLVAVSLAISLSLSVPEDSRASSAGAELSAFVVDGTGEPSDLSDAQLRDIRQLAKQSGKSETEVVNESVGQAEFADLAYRIETGDPDLFVGAGLTRDNSRTGGFLIFTKMPSPEVVEQVAKLPMDVEIRYGARWSQAALEAASEKVIEAAMHSPGVGTVVTSLDREAGQVVVMYATDGDQVPDVEELSRNVAAASQASTGNGSGPGVRVVRDDEVSKGEYEVVVQGGRVLRQGGTDMCTSGYSATKNGNQGLITANHCPDNLDYIGHASAITFGSGGYAAETDMQFHRATTGNTAEAKFQANSGDVRTVGSVSNPVAGQQICMYGVTSGYNCSYVLDTGLCRTNDLGTGQYCGLATSVDRITTGGDSGGPWFYSYTAKGTHTGSFSYQGATRSWFTQIGRAANQINATIMTG